MLSAHSKNNKCLFCVAYFPDGASNAEHTENCFARISAFLSRDGAIKFACTVCRDVFSTPAQLGEHERMHRLPGGFNCTICAATFLCERDRVEHLETYHEAFECLRCDDGELIITEPAYIQHCEQQHNSQSGYALCLACGATFEEKSHLRFHTETECGYLHGWTCVECAAIFSTEDDLNEHSAGHSTSKIKMESDDIDFQVEHVSTECPDSPCEDNDADGDSRENEESLFVDVIQWEDEISIDVKSEQCDIEENMETDENASDDDEESGEESDRKTRASDVSMSEEGTTERCAQDAFKCEFCGKTFSLKNVLNRHRRNNHRDQVPRRKLRNEDPSCLVHRCEFCGKAFKFRSLLLIHHERNHRGEVLKSENQCKKCSRYFETEQILDDHFRRSHAKYQCDKCDYVTASKPELDSHFASECGRKLVNVCVTCGATFKKAKELTAHKAVHASGKPECMQCGRCFSNHSQLRSHMISHKSKENRFKCTYCPRTYFYETALQTHLKQHTGVDSFQCHGCGERFTNMSRLKDHRNERPDTCKQSSYGGLNPSELRPDSPSMQEKSTKARVKDSTFKCHICGQNYTAEKFLKRHIALHGADGKLVHKCDNCSEYFATKADRDQHTNKAHELACPHCPKKCKNRKLLRSHISYKHSKINCYRKRYTCAKCGKSFRSIVIMENHEQSNCGQNPLFKCDICDKTLTSKYTMKAHMQLHQDDSALKPCICSDCGKRFRNQSELKSHMLMHTNEKPYKCSYCDKTFRERSNKERHEITHTGIKPYMCQCGDRFSCISNLQSHRRARKTTCGLLPLVSKRFPKFPEVPEDSAAKP